MKASEIYSWVQIETCVLCVTDVCRCIIEKEHRHRLFMFSNLFADPVDESRPKRSGDNDDEECIASPAILQADLRSGTHAGHFMLEKHAKNLEQCKAACCSSVGCDVAYLKDEECYSVDCVDEDSCLWVNSNDHNVNTAIVYITRVKTKLHHKKGIMDMLCLVYSNSQL